jgi:hypothetical protein
MCWSLRRSFKALFCDRHTLGPKPTEPEGGDRTRVRHLLELGFQVSDSSAGNFVMYFVMSVPCEGK